MSAQRFLNSCGALSRVKCSFATMLDLLFKHGAGISRTWILRERQFFAAQKANLSQELESVLPAKIMLFRVFSCFSQQEVSPLQSVFHYAEGTSCIWPTSLQLLGGPWAAMIHKVRPGFATNSPIPLQQEVSKSGNFKTYGRQLQEFLSQLC